MQEPQTKTVEQQQAEIKSEQAGSLSVISANPEQLQELVKPINDFLSKFPELFVQFFSDYKRPLTTLGFFVAGIITVKMTLALLDAVNDIPLLAPMLELVGIGYTGWFVWRYLWKASTRQELFSEFDKLKSQVLGSQKS